MNASNSDRMLLAPAVILYLALFVLPLIGLLSESLREYEPGHIGSAADAPFTLQNFKELSTFAFANFLWETLRISLLASAIGVLLAFPLSHWIVRELSSTARALVIGVLVVLMFLSVLVRTYALELTFGASGPFRPVLQAIGISANDRAYIEILVAAGLLHYIIPMSALTLLVTVQGVDPALCDASESLGAPRWKSHLAITLPLCAKGLLAAFLFAFTFSISAFVIPMILGKGRVIFISNLIYNRFSETANYPSGSAISVVLLIIALLVVYGLSARLDRRRAK
jgi:putative spermidine/putrescine transport system permease protein